MKVLIKKIKDLLKSLFKSKEKVLETKDDPRSDTSLTYDDISESDKKSSDKNDENEELRRMDYLYKLYNSSNDNTKSMYVPSGYYAEKHDQGRWDSRGYYVLKKKKADYLSLDIHERLKKAQEKSDEKSEIRMIDTGSSN